MHALKAHINRPALPQPTPQRYDSQQLLRGSKEILIEHHGQLYRLKLTRNDKLILNK
jgi:hemin uptake protein HemP